MKRLSLKNFFIWFAIVGIVIVTALVLISIWGNISQEFMYRTIATYVIVFFSIWLISICIKNF
jgi:hypothetical protein